MPKSFIYTAFRFVQVPDKMPVICLEVIFYGRITMKNRIKDKEIAPALLNLAEFCDYLGIGETKARELLHDPKNGFTVRIGNRLYAHKGKVDHWLLKQVVA